MNTTCIICTSEIKEIKCQCSKTGVWKIICPACKEYLIDNKLLRRLRSQPFSLRDSRLLSLFLKSNQDSNIKLTNQNVEQLLIEAERSINETKEVFA